MGEASEMMGVIDRVIERERQVARELVAAHDAHDPEAIAAIRKIYKQARYRRSEKNQDVKLVALAKLRRLDEAGLSCAHCAPESACEIES